MIKEVIVLLFLLPKNMAGNILTSLNPNCPAECQDTATNCLEIISMCFDQRYYEQMQATCQCTCLFCPEPAKQCGDVDPECATKAYECSNPLYTPLMCKYCRLTCNLCNSPCALIPLNFL